MTPEELRECCRFEIGVLYEYGYTVNIAKPYSLHTHAHLTITPHGRDEPDIDDEMSTLNLQSYLSGMASAFYSLTGARP